MKRGLVVALSAVVGLVVLVSAGTWIYINVIREPPAERLSLDATEAPTTTEAAESRSTEDVDGSWTVTTGTEAGYRVPEILNGQSTEAVGRTSAVTGSLTLSGTQATAATFTVDMASIASDESRRDNQFRNRIMEVGTHPTSTFTLSRPIDFGAVPDEGERLAAKATGKLTLKGVTNDVTFDVEGERSGSTIRLAGSIPITFTDYGIDDPSGGPAQVGDEGELEFLLVLRR